MTEEQHKELKRREEADIPDKSDELFTRSGAKNR